MEMCNTGLLFECVGKKLVGKPCEGELHARFDEGKLVKSDRGNQFSTLLPKFGTIVQASEETYCT